MKNTFSGLYGGGVVHKKLQLYILYMQMFQNYYCWAMYQSKIIAHSMVRFQVHKTLFKKEFFKISLFLEDSLMTEILFYVKM